MNPQNAALLASYGVDKNSDWIWRAQNYDPESFRRIITESGLKPRAGGSVLVLIALAVALYFVFKS